MTTLVVRERQTREERKKETYREIIEREKGERREDGERIA